MDFKKKTYIDLINLVKKDDSFFFKDFNLDGKKYRIFNYRLASWTSFMEPSALNCRGITYEVSNEDEPVLVSLPPEKFFNYEEGNVNHKLAKIGDKMVKMDGSLISTYTHNGEVFLKSKGSIFSSQALDAMKVIDTNENIGVKEDMIKMVNMGFTLNFEYTSPENRIVIPYQKEELTLLSARAHEDGENFFGTKLKNFLEKNNLNNLNTILVSYDNLSTQDINQDKFVDDIRNEQEGEGYVVEFILDEKNSYLAKVKNIKYIALHHTKDSVNSPRRLFEAVIEEATDDLRSMFSTDEYVLEKIAEMENIVRPIYNNIVKTVEDFYSDNKDLERKDFAIKAQKENPFYMGLIMATYLKRTPEFKEFAKKYRKELFGIGDDPIVEDVEDIVMKRKATI